MLINWKCANCQSPEYTENPPLKSSNYMQEFYTCKCSKCSTICTVMCYRPMQIQIDFPPFKLN